MVAPSSGKIGRGSGSGRNSNKVGSKRSWAIAKPRRVKSPTIAKMGRSGTVASVPSRRRDEGDGQEGKSKPHISRLLGR